MNLLSSARIAIRALRVNLLRSALTMLGIVIGAGAVITMVAVGSGAQARVAEQIQSLGSNMIIVLSSVTERTREIGLRMAVGARGHDILVQFLVEAVTLSLIGGVLGIALGLGGSYAIAYFAQWRTLVSVEAVGVAFAFSAAVGVFFGFYPARKASRLNPIDALRYE
jgi:putative ABC transport system permease protein